MRRITLFFMVMIVLLVFLPFPSAAAELYVWPVSGKVLLPFKSDAHRGMDIDAAVGDTVVSAQDGTVIWIGKTPRGESCLTIEHEDGISSTYIPVTASVSKGQKVGAGDAVGTVSSEGDPSIPEPHLHFGIYDTATRENKNYLDPIGYLPAVSPHLSIESKKEAVEPASQEVSNLSVEVKPFEEGSLKSTDSLLQTPGSINLTISQSSVHNVIVDQTSPEASYSENDSLKNTVNSVDDSFAQKAPDPNLASPSQSSKILIDNGNRSFVGLPAAKNNSSVVSVRGLIRDDTFYSTSDIGSERSSGYMAQMKDDKNNAKITRTYMGNPKQTLNMNPKIRAIYTSLSGNSSKQIEAINPFTVKKADGEQSLKASVASSEAPQSDSLQSYSDSRHSAVSGWINRIAAWDGLPDAIAILVIIGIVVMSASKLMRNTEVVRDVLPNTVNAAC